MIVSEVNLMSTPPQTPRQTKTTEQQIAEALRAVVSGLKNINTTLKTISSKVR
jgi:hypothetical protein